MPSAQPATGAARTACWLPCGDVRAPLALHTAATLTAGVVQRGDASAIGAVFTCGDAVPWTISNAYYDADVAFRYARDDAGSCAAVLLIVDCDLTDEQPPDAHRELLAALPFHGQDIPIAVAVAVPSTKQASSYMDAHADAVYAEFGWEYVDLADDEHGHPVARLRDALMAHMWHDASADYGTDAASAHPAQLPLPPAPPAMYRELDRFLDADGWPHRTGAQPQSGAQFDDDFSDFVEAPAHPSTGETSGDDVEAIWRRWGITEDDQDSPAVWARMREDMARA
ncbi:hypothetical protein MSPP1_003003 [Malassezia sp. CBS 17886]|nr:hypothetical protein MSPP1_003003 [Malassezia sp. CBS 17886]